MIQKGLYNNKDNEGIQNGELRNYPFKIPDYLCKSLFFSLNNGENYFINNFF